MINDEALQQEIDDQEEEMRPGQVDNPYSKWFTIKDVGVSIGLSIQRVTHHIDNGRIEFIKTPLGRLFNPESVERFKRERAAEKLAHKKAIGSKPR